MFSNQKASVCVNGREHTFQATQESISAYGAKLTNEQQKELAYLLKHGWAHLSDMFHAFRSSMSRDQRAPILDFEIGVNHQYVGINTCSHLTLGQTCVLHFLVSGLPCMFGLFRHWTSVMLPLSYIIHTTKCNMHVCFFAPFRILQMEAYFVVIPQ